MPIEVRGLQPRPQDHLDLRAKLALDLLQPRAGEQRRDLPRESKQAAAAEE